MSGNANGVVLVGVPMHEALINILNQIENEDFVPAGSTHSSRQDIFAVFGLIAIGRITEGHDEIRQAIRDVVQGADEDDDLFDAYEKAIINLDKQKTQAEMLAQQAAVAAEEARIVAERRETALVTRETAVQNQIDGFNERERQLTEQKLAQEATGRELVERAGKLADAAQEQQTREQALTTRAGELDAREEGLNSRSGELDDRSSAFDRSISELNQRSAAVGERETTVSERETKVEEREQGAQTRHDELNRRSNGLDGRSAELDGREKKLKGREARCKGIENRHRRLGMGGNGHTPSNSGKKVSKRPARARAGSRN